MRAQDKEFEVRVGDRVRIRGTGHHRKSRSWGEVTDIQEVGGSYLFTIIVAGHETLTMMGMPDPQKHRGHWVLAVEPTESPYSIRFMTDEIRERS